MNINDILLNDKLNKKLNDSISKTFYRFRLNNVIELDDFEQEVYLFIISRIKNFDECKSTLNTYIPLLVMTAGKRCLEKVLGKQNNVNKREFKTSTVSLDDSFCESDSELYETISDSINIENEVFNSALIDEILSMSNLTDFQKNIIRLQAKGYNKIEIAHIMNCSSDNICVQFSRAKKKILRKYII
jgi:RNA polymerase sigma factor (sigma-70 family)